MTRTGKDIFHESPFPLPNSTIRNRRQLLMIRGFLYVIAAVQLSLLTAILSGLAPFPLIVVAFLFAGLVVVVLVDYITMWPDHLASRPLSINEGNMQLDRPLFGGIITKHLSIKIEEINRLIMKRTWGNGVKVTVELLEGRRIYLGEKRVEEMERLESYLRESQIPLKVDRLES